MAERGQIDEQGSRRDAAGFMGFEDAPIDAFGESEIVGIDDEPSAAFHRAHGEAFSGIGPKSGHQDDDRVPDAHYEKMTALRPVIHLTPPPRTFDPISHSDD